MDFNETELRKILKDAYVAGWEGCLDLRDSYVEESMKKIESSQPSDENNARMPDLPSGEAPRLRIRATTLPMRETTIQMPRIEDIPPPPTPPDFSTLPDDFIPLTDLRTTGLGMEDPALPVDPTSPSDEGADAPDPADRSTWPIESGSVEPEANDSPNVTFWRPMESESVESEPEPEDIRTTAELIRAEQDQQRAVEILSEVMRRQREERIVEEISIGESLTGSIIGSAPETPTIDIPETPSSDASAGEAGDTLVNTGISPRWVVNSGTISVDAITTESSTEETTSTSEPITFTTANGSTIVLNNRWEI